MPAVRQQGKSESKKDKWIDTDKESGKGKNLEKANEEELAKELRHIVMTIKTVAICEL